MVDGGTNAIRRLSKRDAERLLADYDANPIATLSTALRIVLELPDGDWPDLLAAAPLDDSRRRRLLAADHAVLDDLAAELNEARTFGTA